MGFAIDEIVVPSSVDGPDADFIAMIGVRNEVEEQILGTTVLSVTPAGVLPYFANNVNRLRRHFVARVDDVIVARAILGWPTAEGAVEARINVDVLAEYRGSGLGSALLTLVEAEAIALGRTVLQSDQPHAPRPGGPRIPSPTGFGDVPADDPGVRFAVRHGYRLEMVTRISSLDLAGAAGLAREQLQAAQEQAGADYRVVTWAGATPEDRLDDLAALRAGMSTDAPHAGIEMAPDPWDVERVRAHDERQRATGRVKLTAAAEHVSSGRLIAFTEIEIEPGEAPPALQEDTLVLRSHRGHRLGMLLKAANLLHLLDVAPDATVVTTYNAEDNRPMLDVNEALGFMPIGLEGSWQKRVGIDCAVI
ncbi:N-acetyltransferase [Aeromicrobium sp. A1-2]|uniref:GNAT family N-acetyltransferase n=1 Tax=Aeromicrobium sp. A1-2 TaxID=2107713 RepID=UPI000E5324E9|nr:GNAT family N-acetyltransferase [Aeromicrobium sp. A1-2]AXT86317.1 N-acetyltransferase [Aeromicrobium sp. A1-2]